MHTKWTDGAIEKALVGLSTDGFMPKQDELRSVMGLTNAVGRTGGVNSWRVRLSLKKKPARTTKRRWTDDAIAKALTSIAKDGEMPSSACMGTSVSNAVNRHHLGFKGWAERLGLKRRRSTTNIAYDHEVKVKTALEQMGHSVELTRNKCPYDLLVNGSIKVEVKYARPSNCNGSVYHIFHLGPLGAWRDFDVAVFICLSREYDEIATYIIPAEHVQQQTVTITQSRWWPQFKGAWHHIGDE